MIRASIELAVLGGFVAFVLVWADLGAAIVTLLRIGG